MADDWKVVSTKPATAAPDAVADQWAVIKADPANAEATDDLPWDVPVSGAQMRETREKTKQADETLRAIESTAPKEPGFTHLLWSLGAGPFEMAVRGGQSALGERPTPAGVEALEEASLGIRPTPGPSHLPTASGLGGRTMAERGAPQAWTTEQVAATAHQIGAPKAVRIIEKRLNKTEPKTAQEAIGKFNEAAAAGDPLTLPDVFTDAEKLAGRMARSGGEASSAITSSLEGRNAGAVERLTGNINRDVGADSAYQMFDDLKQARSAAAKPLFEKAYEGGSLAPLETQVQKEMTEARAAMEEPGAGPETSARYLKAVEMARKVRENKDLGLKGAVWSPRIQEFLADPEIQQGIRRGLWIEGKEALAERRPMNPSDYAITGVDAAGAPIIGEVPTMRLLAVAKEGIDAMLQSKEYRNELTGELTKPGVALAKAQREYLAELDRLNPDYKAAREQWSGDTSNMIALKAGQTALKNKPEINASLAANMTESERESAKLGLAQTLREIAQDKGPLAGEFNTIPGTQYGAEGNRARIAPFFNDEKDLDRFVKSIGREQVKARTANKVLRGSQTAERLAEDEGPITARDVAHGAIAGALGHKATLANRIFDVAHKFWDSRGDPRTNAEIARILGSSGIKVERDAHGRIIVRQPEAAP